VTVPAFKRNFLVCEMAGAMRSMTEPDASSPLVWPGTKIRMVRGKTFVTLLVACLAGRVVHRREIEFRTMMLAMTSSALELISRRQCSLNDACQGALVLAGPLAGKL
jgi:hypothetical protein